MNESIGSSVVVTNTNASSTNSNQSSTSTTTTQCCEFFIDSLNRLSATNTKNILRLNVNFCAKNENTLNSNSGNSNTPVQSSAINNNNRNEDNLFVLNNDLNQTDIESFLTYCNIWQQKQCVCVFTKDDLVEKFHHFIHNLIATSIIVIKYLPFDNQTTTTTNANTTATDSDEVSARQWSLDQKEKLLVSLIKILTLNMPLYLTYKHLLFNNHGRYSRLGECSCSKLNQDSLNLIQVYCTSQNNNHTQNQTNNSNKTNSQEFENLPIEYLRNICHFIDLNGLNSIKYCFQNAQPDNLPLNIAHLLFSIIVNIRVWLNPSVIEQQIVSMRSLVINYMCLLSDKDLRLAGTRNTTELMYESFKLPGLNSYINTLCSSDSSSSSSSSSNSSSSQNSQERCLVFKIDRDGLSLAYKYFTSSTLTIRLCGVAQMNLQISAWSEFNSLNTTNSNFRNFTKSDKNELADWLVENNIIEYLYGPNLHVEVIKRSQDIVNFLAFTNRLNEKHLDVIWSSAQLKHCSKPVMDTLMTLHKHLSLESIQYLSRLVSKLDLNQQNEQTLLLSALLTKTLWSMMLDMGDRQETHRGDSKLSKNNFPTGVNHRPQRKRRTVQQKPVKTNYSSSSSEDEENEIEEEEEKEDDEDDNEEQETNDSQIEKRENGIEIPKKPQRIIKRHNQSMDTQMSNSGDEEPCIKRKHVFNEYVNNLNNHDQDEDEEEDADYEEEEDDDEDEDSENEDNEEEEEEEDDEENEEGVDQEVNRVLSSKYRQKSTVLTRNQRKEFENKQESNGLDEENILSDESDEEDEDDDQEDMDQEIMEINKIILSNKLKSKENNIVDNRKLQLGEDKNQSSNSNLVELLSMPASLTSLNNKKDNQNIEQTDEDDDELNSHSSNISNPSVKDMKEFDDDEEVENIEQEQFNENQALVNEKHNNTQLNDEELTEDSIISFSNSQNNHKKNSSHNLNRKINIQESKVTSSKKLDINEICQNGNTFLWDLLINTSHSAPKTGENETDPTETNLKQTNNLTTSSIASSSLPNEQIQMPALLNLPIETKILKEAEKQLQTLLCLPSTDRRIRFKFIENCLNNLKEHKACTISLRLLTKLFSSFQQYTSNSFSYSNELKCLQKSPHSHISQSQRQLLYNTLHQSHLVEIHKIVALTELKFGMIDIFFDNLKSFCSISSNCLETRGQVQARLQFLSFIFSTLGSPRDFELSIENVELLWDSLIKFNEQDDLFNWFLNQAKNKDQHAISIETFKLIFLNKIPLLDPNNFSPNALHLYQELFKIYKFSSQQSDSKMEACAIDYITKLAFKSNNNEVSLSAIQFLNSHYTQSDTINSSESQEKFIQNCLIYLDESRVQMELLEPSLIESNLTQIQRGLILLKNHLDLFQRRNSYQLRMAHFLNHSKRVEYTSNSFLNLNCHINSTQFKFNLIISHLECVGDLKAVVREILLRIVKIGKENNLTNEDLIIDPASKLVFNANNLNQQEQFRMAYNILIQSQIANSDILDSEDEFCIKIYANGQEITANQVIESKLLSEIGLKDQQTIHVSLFTKVNTSKQSKLDLNSIPMVILAKEAYFSSLFRLINLLTELNSATKIEFRKRIGSLAFKLWKVISLIPSSTVHVDAIAQNQEWHLAQLLDYFLAIKSTKPEKASFNLNTCISFDRPYQILYYLQLVEIVFKKELIDQETKKCELWSKYLYKLLLAITKYLSETSHLLTNVQESEPNNTNLDVLLECSQIILKLLTSCLFNPTKSVISNSTNSTEEDNGETPRKRTKRSFTLVTSSKNIPEIKLDMLLNVIESDLDVFLNLNLNLQQLTSLSQTECTMDLLQNSMQLLLTSLSCLKLRNALVHSSLKENRLNWFKSLILIENSVLFRREACSWLYRLCLCDQIILDQFLSELLSLLYLALKYKPKSETRINCKDYFLLMNTLISNESIDRVKLMSIIDFEQLIKFVCDEMQSREYYEVPNVNSASLNYVEDDLLTGLLSLSLAIVKSRLVNKISSATLVDDLFDYLLKLSSNDSPDLIEQAIYPRVRLPKFRSAQSRSLCFDLIVELCKFNSDNFKTLYQKLLNLHQHQSDHLNPWDYWPKEDVRSVCGYLGLVNLGATCYMATSLQHLFMIKQARDLILNSSLNPNDPGIYDKVLIELKKIFAFLQESERKAYNPKELCKVYTMDQQPLNTGEQKDMQEFFTDLISKLEETSDPRLKTCIKHLFGGVITNMVISLDCSHVSSTLEEFYTVRCQVAGMKDLYESLNEITVKDTLEGDNMYTCSKCSRKVRAEKRACFRQLPQILCFNTMRYTFNMVTMQKEKVNTHFSFPLQLNMSGYMEKNLIKNNSSENSSNDYSDEEIEFMYELIGVTVHTGTADGGHYYSFISENESEKAKWYLFNDAEVKPFDAESQLASECFGGEATSKTYDSQSDKFMDLSFEKTNSAYMLFYEKKKKPLDLNSSTNLLKNAVSQNMPCSVIKQDQELMSLIWKDNLKFIKDKLIYEPAYFSFVYQLCELSLKSPHLVELGARMGVTFFLETYIHARDKPNMLQWVELLGKLFNSSLEASKWFLSTLAENPLPWLTKILIKCPNSSIRQAFQRSLLNITSLVLKQDQELIEKFINKYLDLISADESERLNIRYMSEYFGFLTEFARIGQEECLILIKSGAVQKCSNFYAKNRRHKIKKSESLCRSLSSSSLDTVTSLSILSDNNNSLSDPESDSLDLDQEIIPLHDQKSKLKVFERVISLIGLLAEKNFVYNHQKHHEQLVNSSLKPFKLKFFFFYNAILDDLNLNSIKSILFSILRAKLCTSSHSVQEKEEEEKILKKLRNFATKFINMCIRAIRKLQTKQANENERCMPFFNALGSLFLGKSERINLEDQNSINTECTKCTTCVQDLEDRIDFVQLIIDRVKVLFDSAPYHTLQWLISVCGLNRKIEQWLLDNMSTWVRALLIDSKQTQIRFSAGILLVNLVPDRMFRQAFTSNRNMLLPYKIKQQNTTTTSADSSLSDEANSNELNYSFDTPECKQVVQKIIKHLFSLIEHLEQFINETKNENDQSNHLIQYFTLLIYFMCSPDEKRLFVSYNQTIEKFWSKIYYPSIANNHVCSNLNKQVAVHFFYHCLNQCTENLDYICQYTVVNSQTGTRSAQQTKPKIVFTSRIAKELPMCTVVVDHEDGDLISYNRQCLHPYYASLRLLCEHSKVYLREMCQHTNFQWAFKHIMPYSIQYPQAVLELVKLVGLFVRQEAVRTSESKMESEETTSSVSDESSESEESDDESDSIWLKQWVSSFKENLCTQFLMSPQIDPKQCWQSIVMLMKTIIQTFEDATLVLTRRGLSNLSTCFFQISLIYHHQNLNQQQEQTQTDLLDCIQILLHLCETVKHHMDKRTDGIRQIQNAWKEKLDLVKRLLLLANFYTTNSIRNRALDLLRSILVISPQEILHNCVNLIWSSYFSSNTAALLNQYSNSCQSYSRGSILSSKPSVPPLSQCALNSQSLNQALNLMGPYFPLCKKLNHSLLNNKPSKPAFNMFLPILFVSHAHLDGAIFLSSQIQPSANLDYEKQLVESYVPYLTFFDYLCQSLISRRADTSSSQSLKHLIDLILYITQQSVLLNISFISYLNNQLNSEQTNATTSSSSQAQSEFFTLIAESAHLTTFMRTILTDYRYLINRKEIYDFFQVFMSRFILNISQDKVQVLKEENSLNQVSILSQNLKSIISLSLCTINEIRFYFEFNKEQEESSDNLTLNLDFKSAHMLGSIKTIHLILQTVGMRRDKQFVKFLKQIKHFFVSYNSYLHKQYTQMSSFVEKKEEKEEEDESSKSKRQKFEVDSGGQSKILKQVEIKRKALNQIVQALSQTVYFIDGLVEQSGGAGDEEEAKSSSEETECSSSEATSTSSSSSSSSSTTSTSNPTTSSSGTMSEPELSDSDEVNRDVNKTKTKLNNSNE